MALEIEIRQIETWQEIFMFPPAWDTIWAALHGVETEPMDLPALRTLVKKDQKEAARMLRKADPDRRLLRTVLSALRERKEEWPVWLRRVEARVKEAQRYWETFYLGNLRLVAKVALGYKRHDLHAADLIQEGNWGLMIAVNRFDPHRGFAFSTFAVWWIKHAIRRFIQDHRQDVRAPVHMQDKRRAVGTADWNATNKKGLRVTPEELAEEMGLPEREVRKIRPHFEVSLSAPVAMGKDGDARSLGDVLATEQESPLETLMDASVSEALRTLVLGKRLLPREKGVIILRYGLDGNGERTLKEVAEKMGGLSRERVRQIELMALDKLAIGADPSWR